ncbi:MAG TPA: MBL fold metallo-hydrolase [Chloroflexota bacterium]|nr:MBL fold metallo-hydrolase [Chloroflexota bacterium]HUM69825.1 MBL fold metallo-hydrolase [Chloroflexota bacterium]
MAALELVTRQVGPWGMNTYALICPETNQSVLIDPGDEPEILQEMLGKSQPTAILLTHTHVDHIGALAEMRLRLAVPVAGNDGPHEPHGQDVGLDQVLRAGDVVSVGLHSLRVYYTPGHIGDQVCFVLENDRRAIVGDTIFDGGPGKTWSAEAFQTTLQTLQNVVLQWPDDTVCYPGHGPSFRLGDRRAQMEAFAAKDHGDFFGDATWDM